MRIISCASYYGTGSSAITDLISEYEKVFSLTDFEFRFVQDPDGISDLEYNLLENHNRHNSGHALKRYKKLVDFYSGNMFMKKYEPFFNNQWKKISYEYINALCDFQFKGWWQYDLYDKGLMFYYRKAFMNKILKLTIWRKKADKYLNVLPNEITYCSNPSEEKFYKLTRKYINSLFEIANKEKKENIMVDQLVPPTNLIRYTKYFDNIFIFIVERDPRDIYILEKEYWKTKVIPTDSVEIFCKWYVYTRVHRKKEIFPDNVYFLYFEDLIYKYDETVKKIESVLGFREQDHILKKKFLNPTMSIKNSRLWINNEKYERDIEYIENNLKSYLYDYSFLEI